MHWCNKLHRDQLGLLSIANITLTLFLTITTILLLNAGASLSDRTQSQQKADAVAKSLGTWKSRNLNAVTAHQHHIGELLAVAIVHHAIGGDNLDKQRVGDTEEIDYKLDSAYQAAKMSEKGTPAYKDVRSEVKVGAALLDAHRNLKKLLTMVYVAKAVAIALKAFPPTYSAGLSLENAAHLLELKLWQEWKVLKQIERQALTIAPIKKQIMSTMLPEAKLQLVQIVEDYSRSQAELAEFFEDRLKVKIHIMDSDRRLPIVIDPLAALDTPPSHWEQPTDCDCPSDPADNMRHQIAKVTQLARATFPWVNYHRQPIVTKMKRFAPLSKIGEYYFDYAAGFSKRWADELQRPEGNSRFGSDYRQRLAKHGQLALFVVDDYQGPDKAIEPWTREDNSHHADRAFGITALVGSPTRQPIGEFFFHSTTGDCTYRLSTAVVWNRQRPNQANQMIDLTCKRIVPSFQAETGWDLLNWKSGAKVPELVGFGIVVNFPAIELGWTSNLSPTSAARIREIQTQPLPDWATKIRDVLPDEVPADFIAL
jgi:hypothetical protein